MSYVKLKQMAKAREYMSQALEHETPSDEKNKARLQALFQALEVEF